jgi:hypothetical protein
MQIVCKTQKSSDVSDTLPLKRKAKGRTLTKKEKGHSTASRNPFFFTKSGTVFRVVLLYMAPPPLNNKDDGGKDRYHGNNINQLNKIKF